MRQGTLLGDALAFRSVRSSRTCVERRLTVRWPMQRADDVLRGCDCLVQHRAYSLQFLRTKSARSGLTLGVRAEVQAHRDKCIQEIVHAPSSRVSAA